MKEDKNLSFKKEEELINYQAYKTWLVAMLTKNKEEITDYTLEMADVILRYRNTGKGNSRITLVEKELFTSKSKKGFIESLTLILPDLENEDLKRLKTLKDEIHLMTNEEFGYFIALLKFDYAFIQKRP
jgi:predicted hydrolase (HD superfamily)